VIPVQDVVPSRQTPIATVAIIALTVLYFLVNGGGPPGWAIAAPLAHRHIVTLVFGTVLLWLFGDNVEARLGRITLCIVFVVAGWLPALGASGGVTAIMGSYFMLLPRSKILTAVPFPPVLLEVPAVFFMGAWTVLHVLRFVAEPRAVWAFGLAFLFGVAIARLTRPPVAW
jgi:membrane associated rhomboid family serine protease